MFHRWFAKPSHEQDVAAGSVLAHVWGRADCIEHELRKVLILTVGWLLTIVGIVLTPMPIPIPLIGVLPLMAGLAILINNSRGMRRAIQRVRHRVRWFSFMIEHAAHRLPKKIGQILHRSHPAPIVRKERIMTRPPEEIESKS